MLYAGLIGLGPEWEDRYRPALLKLRQRLRVCSVYTPVIAHADQVAAELACDVAPGMVALMERDDVRALLVLDTAWYAGVPAQLACLVGKAAYLAGPLLHRVPVADHLLLRAAQTGVTLMPDFAHRYTPATSRLRELIATRLGRPLTIAVDLPLHTNPAEGSPPLPAGARETLAATIDWCTNLVGTPPAAVRGAMERGEVPSADGGKNEIHVEFRRPAAGGEAAVATIRLDDRAPATERSAGPAAASIGLRACVQCAKGTAWLESPQQVKWESAKEKACESLVADRPAVEVMLDHFARRVVGGLIPVPTLEDLCRAFQLAEMALEGALSRSPQSTMR
jgi:predicted dehydrogenase